MPAVIDVNQGLVNPVLIGGDHPDQPAADRGIYVLYRLKYAEAEVAFRVAVPQFACLVLPG